MNELFTPIRVFVMLFVLACFSVNAQVQFAIKSIEVIAASGIDSANGGFIVHIDGGLSPYKYGVDNYLRGKSDSNVIKIIGLKPGDNYSLLVYDAKNNVVLKENLSVSIK